MKRWRVSELAAGPAWRGWHLDGQCFLSGQKLVVAFMLVGKSGINHRLQAFGARLLARGPDCRGSALLVVWDRVAFFGVGGTSCNYWRRDALMGEDRNRA
jgi:hypothetical protein